MGYDRLYDMEQHKFMSYEEKAMLNEIHSLLGVSSAEDARQKIACFYHKGLTTGQDQLEIIAFGTSGFVVRAQTSRNERPLRLRTDVLYAKDIRKLTLSAQLLTLKRGIKLSIYFSDDVLELSVDDDVNEDWQSDCAKEIMKIAGFLTELKH